MEARGAAMSLDFVLDSSVTMTWFFEDEATSATDELLDGLNQDGRAVVAAHWALEVSNTLLMAERRKRTTIAESSEFLAILDALPIETDPHTADRASTTTLALARTHGLTLYDGAYLELAMRRSLPLATLDRDLRAAAKRTGVSCLPKDR
jgi:predicted nucleic acid-binding protein